MPLLVTLSFFFIVYRFVPVTGTALAARAGGRPARDPACGSWPRPASPGTSATWPTTPALYGTLEGVIVLALWLEVSVSIILYCGEVVALLDPPAPPA